MAKKRTTTKAEADAPPSGDGIGTNWVAADLTFMQRQLTPAPTFPLQYLTPAIEALVRGFSNTQHLSAAYVGPTVLTTLSGAIGNRWRIGLTPSKTEPLALFVAMVGRPGSGRSTVIEIAQDALQQAEAAIIGHRASTPRSSVGSQELSAHQARQTSSVMQRILQSGAFPADLDEDEASSGPPLVLCDATGAGFIDELQHDARGRTLLSAEFRGVLTGLMAGQGHRGRTILLQAFDGPRYPVKLKAGFIVVPALLLTVLAALHPKSVGHITQGDGLCARFLWTYPDVAPIHELPSEAGPADLLRKLSVDLVRSGGSDSSGQYYDTIALSDEARAVLDGASRTFNAGLDDLGDGLRDVYVRGPQQARRISAVFAVAEAVSKGERPVAVSGEDAERAVGLMADFFLPMAERALTVARDREEAPAIQLARHLRRVGKAAINSREDILRGRGSPLRDAGVIQDALRELQLRGLLQPAERVGLGRPAQNWHVHPALLTA
ncbi:DUF3987 domain-containing protein [Bradyrhizobium septentrionale]|uniref:DUF3987 domain-containing protein n=1 Tax=Bradyrhizobium septentrionale TaxID=1404411 RepID=UPI0015970F38|nr:DUF3987 domain-containing protein [Bradyrhizobium septentrionale]UGY26664.1 DUF3987 domain-containing protein [Bradyrhizobium septentrionale]